jgi:hypothetical protein
MLTIRHLLSCVILCALMLTACQRAAEAPEPTPPVETVAPREPEAADEESAPTATTEPMEPTDLLVVVETPAPTDTPTPEPTATQAEPTAAAVPTETPEPSPTPRATAAPAVDQPIAAAPAAISTSALIIREDETVAPPFDVTVSANRELPGYNFMITGLVRNVGSENYAGLGIVATFFRADGSRHGPIKVNLQCPLLAPGDACPFAVDANAKGLTEVMIHPEGYPTTRTTAQVDISGVGRSVDGIGYVHITGSVANPNPVPVNDVTISGMLLDQAGEIVSIGTDILVGALEAGATSRFEVVLRYAPYVQYQLLVQAEPR